MITKTQTTTTHYHIQKKRRAEFIEEWRQYRQSVVREEDVVLKPTERGSRTDEYLDILKRVWTADGKPDGLPMMHPDRVLAVAVWPDEERAVTTCRDGNARVWDLVRREAAPIASTASRQIIV